MTCIGNSGPLPDEVGEAIEKVGYISIIINIGIIIIIIIIIIILFE